MRYLHQKETRGPTQVKSRTPTSEITVLKSEITILKSEIAVFSRILNIFSVYYHPRLIKAQKSQ